MLDKLKGDFDGIMELVNKCPAPLQEKALEVILTNWFRSNALADRTPLIPIGGAPPAPGTPQINAVLPAQAVAFMTANAITGDVMTKAFQPLGAGAQLLVSNIEGTGKAAKQAHLTLLLCVRQALETGVFSCTLKSVREMCVHYDCYDSANFSKTFKSYKGLFKPRSKGADLELSGPGQKKAADLIKGLQAAP